LSRTTSRAESTRPIGSYLEDREAAATRGLRRSAAVRLLRLVSSHGFRQSGKLHATKLFVPASVLKVRRLTRERRQLLLHLGSGAHKLPGWVNVDIFGMQPDLYWDLRWGVPFPDGSAGAVFLEHVLEHFTLADGLKMLEDCRRVLVPGGRIRVGVPDFGSYLRSYAGDRSFIERNRPGRPTPLLAVAEVALGHGHRSVWDGETLVRVLEEAGFTGAEVRTFGDSSIQPEIDSTQREPESVYAEAEKPGV
jgi:predicted SAM-dependent methyltransferase